MRFLSLLICAPLCSFGNIARGGVRETALRPMRSQLCGMFGAALGIDRCDTAGLKQISKSFQITTHIYSTGNILVDYHTAQSTTVTPEYLVKKYKHPTRYDELYDENAIERTHTTISKRSYISDFICGLTVSERENSTIDLDSLADAIKKPKYTLFLGRKSCPLSSPAFLGVFEAKSCLEAIENTWKSAQDTFLIKDLLSHRKMKIAPSTIIADAPLDETSMASYHVRIENKYEEMNSQFGIRGFSSRKSFLYDGVEVNKGA